MAKRKLKFSPEIPDHKNFWTILASKTNWNGAIKTVAGVAIAWIGVQQYFLKTNVDEGKEMVARSQKWQASRDSVNRVRDMKEDLIIKQQQLIISHFKIKDK